MKKLIFIAILGLFSSSAFADEAQVMDYMNLSHKDQSTHLTLRSNFRVKRNFDPKSNTPVILYFQDGQFTGIDDSIKKDQPYCSLHFSDSGQSAKKFARFTVEKLDPRYTIQSGTMALTVRGVKNSINYIAGNHSLENKHSVMISSHPDNFMLFCRGLDRPWSMTDVRQELGNHVAFEGVNNLPKKPLAKQEPKEEPGIFSELMEFLRNLKNSKYIGHNDQVQEQAVSIRERSGKVEPRLDLNHEQSATSVEARSAI